MPPRKHTWKEGFWLTPLTGWSAFLWAAAWWALAAVLSLYFWQWIKPSPYVLFFPVIAVIAARSGPVYGMCAAAAVTVLIYALMEPDGIEILVPSVAMLFSSAIISYLAYSTRQAESESLGTRQTLSFAMQHANMGEWLWPLGSEVLRYSLRTAEILGLSPSGTATAEQARSLLAPQDLARVRAAFAQATENAGKFEFECRIQKPGSPEPVWISLTGRVVAGAGGEPAAVSGVVQDITARKEIENQREQLLNTEQELRAEAERANRLKDEFLATLSHELRTPLNAILGWANLLMSGRIEPSQIPQAAEIIQRNTRIQTQLVDDLLDMNRIITGKVRMDMQPVQLANVVEDAISSVLPAVESKRLQLTKQLAPVGKIQGDPARLQQVVWNLLTNATKFTPEEGGITVALQPVNSHVEITVSDTGAGIAQDQLPIIFDKFRQVDSSMSRRHGGLGLGLAICKHLVELHGGRIYATSAGLDQGSTFHVELPVETSSPAHTPGEIVTTEPRDLRTEEWQVPDLTGLRLLVVDDEPDARNLVARLLQEGGAEIQLAGSGAEALKICESQSIDILISDLGMPGMDGTELIRRVRTLPQGDAIQAIAVTAFARDEDRQNALAQGFNYFSSKPVDPAELMAHLAGCVSQLRPK